MRALRGRPVHERCGCHRDLDGEPLDLDRRFGLDDDPEELAHFLAGAPGSSISYDVFDPSEMAAIEADIDQSIAAALMPIRSTGGAPTPRQAGCGPLAELQEKSAAVRATLADERLPLASPIYRNGHRGSNQMRGW